MPQNRNTQVSLSLEKLFSYKNRPVHLGPYPLERLARQNDIDLSALPQMSGLNFQRSDDPLSIVNAMGEYQAMLDATRDGLIKKEIAQIPSSLDERSNHLKAFGYYCDSSMVGSCEVSNTCWLPERIENPDVARLADKIQTMQPKTLAAGIDVIMAGLRESMRAPTTECRHHSHALVFLYDMSRAPDHGEKIDLEWIKNAQAHRACLRGMETAVTLASYIRTLGYEARAHSMAESDVDLYKLAARAGLIKANGDNPFVGKHYGLAAITTTLELAPDRPLNIHAKPPTSWYIGTGANAKSARNHDPYKNRSYVDGPHPFETLKRVDDPTTYIDAPNVARVPKRANLFARGLFGDMGKHVQDATKNGNYVRKSAAAFAFRPSLGAFVLLQDGDAAPEHHPNTQDPGLNAANIKAALYWLGVDAVGLSACPDWTYYSHDAAGQPITPYHQNAISMIIDQGHETMEGASGDDWIACAQSMRAYLRFSLLGGVLAQHLRNLGYTARVHSVMDDEVLHPPLLLLSGLGEVSRIGEVILNPFLGPRLKSGVVTTNMPMTHDKPIDFGLQKFCEACNKCARECPSGAITAGPKLMFNGYEIWKSDSQKCTTYRVSQKNGAMCGRCMKTCPWNLEGLFAEAPFRKLAMTVPQAAKALAKLDDVVGKGEINPVKKWWWDLEMVDDGAYRPSSHPVNARTLQKDLDLKFEDQTLAVYPAPLAPPPYAYPYPMDREAGIEAYQNMISAEAHKIRRDQGLPPEHIYTADTQPSPVMSVVIKTVDHMAGKVTKYEFASADDSPLPQVDAGAHIDVVVAPEFLRQYSLSGDPSDRSKYQIAVLREDEGRGGSKLMHRIFEVGRRVHISKPINHFPLHEDASFTYLMGGGIGITPMIAMAHRLHAINANFTIHYSISSRASAGFLDDLIKMPWADKVHLHISAEGSRCDLKQTLTFQPNAHVYTCGPEIYMNAVMSAAETNGYPEENRHLEFFAVPEQPEYENSDFTLKLAKSGRDILVKATEAPSDALLRSGIHVDVKCADGLCGVCKCGVLSGEVEHRDFVLSNKERQTAMILCQSRAKEPNGVIEIDL